MIISDQHRYLFVELPLTGSTAIAAELTELYEGRSIYYKHANYRKFLTKANAQQKGYFTFIGIRNPMDMAVSHYHKYLANPGGKFDGIEQRRSSKNPIKHYWNQRKHQRRFRFVQENKPSFSEFFLRFYDKPYTNWSTLDRERMDGIIRFEHIQEDFAKVLCAIGIEPVRPIPQKNKTKGKDKDFWSFYDTVESRRRAAEIFGPYMKEWGYAFPEEWKVTELMDKKISAYRRSVAIKRPYWIFTGR